MLININARLRTAVALAGLSLFTMGVAEAVPINVYCNASEVVIFVNESRMHVRCERVWGTGLRPGVLEQAHPEYFALSTQSPEASRILTILNSALERNRTLVINYDRQDLSGAAIGCLTSDCRLIRVVGQLNTRLEHPSVCDTCPRREVPVKD